MVQPKFKSREEYDAWKAKKDEGIASQFTGGPVQRSAQDLSHAEAPLSPGEDAEAPAWPALVKLLIVFLVIAVLGYGCWYGYQRFFASP